MKINYILLILLFSFSLANAQDNSEAKKDESNVMVSQNNEDVVLNLTAFETISIIKENLDNEADMARNSDIKIYFNRLQNVENIYLLFPLINKTVKA